jgi:hypothetical protein
VRLSSLNCTLVAAAATVALAACSSQGAIPLQSTTADNAALNMRLSQPLSVQPLALPLSDDALSPDAAKSACDLKGTWYFKGSCVKANVVKAGGTFSLAAYKGITMKVTTGTTGATKAVPFIVGNGTSKTDITGTNNGKAFPFMSAKPGNCITVVGSQGNAATCPTPFVYFEEINDSKTNVTIPDWPSSTISNTGKYPGKTCTLAIMVSTKSGAMYWDLLPITGKVSGSSVTLKGKKATGVITANLNGGYLDLFAIGCK